MMQPKIGSYVVYEPAEEGWENWENQFKQINEMLANFGMDIISAPMPIIDLESMEKVLNFFCQQEIDVLHALINTWSFDHYSLELYQNLQIPIIIRSIPGIRTGSIVGAQQLASVMADLGMKHRVFYGGISDIEVVRKIAEYATASGIIKNLAGSRIGVVGRRTEGMTPTAVDEIEVMRLFGVRLIHYGLDEFLTISSDIPVLEVKEIWEDNKFGAKQVLVNDNHGILSASHYLACKKIIEQHSLDALTIGSYPMCQGTMCLPIAWVNEEGFPTGCEGDVNSTINMLILSYLSDQPVHFGEMLEIDEKNNTIVTSHCGCGSPSLADNQGFVLAPVRIAQDGVCIRYAAKPGPVTFVNLTGRKHNYRLCAFEGQAIPTSLVFEGNPIKIKLKTPIKEIWSDLDCYSFGHHWMTAYAHVVPVLHEFCRLIGLQGVFPDRCEKG